MVANASDSSVAPKGPLLSEVRSANRGQRAAAERDEDGQYGSGCSSRREMA